MPGIGSTYTIPPGNLFTGDRASRQDGQDAPRDLRHGRPQPDAHVARQADRLADDGLGRPGRRRPERRRSARRATRTWPRSRRPATMAGRTARATTSPTATATNATATHDRLVRLRRAQERVAVEHRPASNLPPATPTNMWYAGGGGGPVFPNDPGRLASRTTARRRRSPSPTSPAAAARRRCPARLYRYDEDNASTTKFPEFWNMKWFFDDNNRSATARAVGLDADTVDNHKPPKTAVDITGLDRQDRPRRRWAWTSAPTATSTSSTTAAASSPRRPSSRCGRSATRVARRRRARRRAAIPIGDFKVNFSSGGSGGVSYKWEFGDGATSTEANPTHTYAEAKTLHGQADGDLRRR